MIVDRLRLSQLYNFSQDTLFAYETQGLYHQTFRFTRGADAFILRISPPGEHDTLLERKMTYLHVLFQAGCPVIEPIRSVNQRLVEVLQATDGSLRQITVTRQAIGATHDLLFPDSLPRSLYTEIGKSLAILHDRSADLSTADFAFRGWQDGENCFNAAHHQGFSDQRIVRQYLVYREKCLTRTEEGRSSGIIHGDLHFSNIILDPIGSKVTFCDFDDACMGPYVMDLAMILLDLGVILQSENKSMDLHENAYRIIDGYNQKTMHHALSLRDIHDFIKLLECSLYIQFYDYFQQSQVMEQQVPNPTGWLELFFGGRKERILEDQPFLL
jgi:Ser/Thr protein kinase RdoA (MazF antagonist)